jgi:hypothetical protein
MKMVKTVGLAVGISLIAIELFISALFYASMAILASILNYGSVT